ncbi:tetratricopeptide repeat protein [Pedobacter sp.]|uniref:tetratricopeptide repeat protein n=1 Tax=Pedobacter sp. TaxID=1411316 RepID=UPI003D7FAB01
MDLVKKISLVFIFGSITLATQAQDTDNQSTTPDERRLLDYYQTQRYTEAAQYLQQLKKTENQNYKLLAQEAYVYLMAGALPAAEEILLKLYEKQPKSLSVLCNLAEIEVKRGRNNKAKAYYKDIIALDSTHFNAYKQLAALSKQATTQERTAYLVKANTLNPIAADVVADLCEIYFKTNAYDQASAILAPALKADSANWQLREMKIPISMAAKKYNDAIQTGQKLLSEGDSSSYMMNNLGKSYLLTLDYKNALNCFLKVQKDTAENEVLLYQIALCYRGLRDYTNASIYLKKVIEKGISEKTASYYGLLGDAYEQSKKNQEAINAYKRGLQFENNGSLYYNIGLVYENRLNDKKNAIANYELYLKNYKEIKSNAKLERFIKSKIEELKR